MSKSLLEIPPGWRAVMFSLGDGTLQPNPGPGSGVMRSTDCRKYLINIAVNTALAMPTRPRRGRMLPSCVRVCQGRQEKTRERTEKIRQILLSALPQPLGASGGGKRRMGQGHCPLSKKASPSAPRQVRKPHSWEMGSLGARCSQRNCQDSHHHPLP